jgi:hypothetical protein
MLAGWSEDPAVLRILDGFSRIHAAKLIVVERDRPEGTAASGWPGPGLSGEVVLGDSRVGWVVLESAEGDEPGLQSLVREAASAVSAHVDTLSEIESLSGEIAGTYEELNLLYNLSGSLGSPATSESVRSELEAKRVTVPSVNCRVTLASGPVRT